MLINYLKIALRNIRKHPLFSFINIFGLGLSLSVCMIVTIRLKDALDIDRFHPKADRIYRVTSHIKTEDNTLHLASSPLPLTTVIRSNSTAIENAVTWYPALHDKAVANNKSIDINGGFTTPDFFEIFGFKLSGGNIVDALAAPNSLVLSHDAATRIFGSGEALNKVIEFENMGACKVTGILEKEIGKSHLVFDALVSASSLPQLEAAHKLPAKINNWNSFDDAYTYVLLQKDANKKSVENALAGIATRINTAFESGAVKFNLQALDRISPSKDRQYREIGPVASWGKVLTEAGVALLILIAACFNYVNLTIARALTRGKEVGIRKLAGASRFQVFLQYIFEGVLFAMLALFIAYALLSVILKYQLFNDGYQFLPNEQPGFRIIIFFILISLLTGLLAGSAPAWILSAFKPVNVLKNVRTTKLFGNITLQKTLVVFQFALSLTIIIFLSIFYRQFSYMESGNYGFRQNNIIAVDVKSADADVLVNELKKINGVGLVTRFTGKLGSNAAGSVPVRINKENPAINTGYYFGDAATVPVFNLKLLAGENFDEQTLTNQNFVLLNEKAVSSYQLGTNHEAIGKQLLLNDTTSVTVKGVVKDFHYEGMGRPVQPLMIRTADNYTSLYLTTTTNDYHSILPLAEKAFKNIAPYDNFSGTIFSKQIEAYNDQSGTINLLGFLAFMTIFIASFGLLGLVIYSVETRRKEISVRKILGASVSQLITLLSKNYFKLLLIAASFAMPLGYLLSYFFLQNFEYRITPGWNVLIVSFLFLLTVGVSTIFSQTYRASMLNPADNLRSE